MTNDNNKIARQEIQSIDILKLIMAFAVITIHAPEFLFPDNRIYPFPISTFIRLAVPYFFTVSGFFMMRKIDCESSLRNRTALTRTRAKKFFKLYIYWLLIYLPLSMWGYFSETSSLTIILRKYATDVLIGGGSLYAHQLWFIYSLAIVTLVISTCVNKNKSIEYLFVIFICYSCLQLSGNSDVYSAYRMTTRILGGGVCITAGMLMYKYRELIARYFTIIIAICVICAACAFYYDFNLWTFFGGCALMLIVERIKISPTKFDYRRIRSESMWIYYTHMYVIMGLYIMLCHTGLKANRWLMLFVASFMSYLLARALIFLSSKKRFASIKALIS